jgi:hypothetical protein
VELIEDLGDTKVLDLDCAGTAMRIRVGDESVPPEGAVISVTARPHDIHLFDPAHKKANCKTMPRAYARRPRRSTMRAHPPTAQFPAACTSRSARPSAARSRTAKLIDKTGPPDDEAELGRHFGVSRITIRNAISPLVDEGMFARARGRGTFLRSNQPENWVGKLMGFSETIRDAGYQAGAKVLNKA